MEDITRLIPNRTLRKKVKKWKRSFVGKIKTNNAIMYLYGKLLAFILLFDYLCLAPFPRFYNKMRPDERFASRTLNLVFLVVTPIVIAQTVRYYQRLYNSPLVWIFKFEVAVVVCLAVGYVISRCGLQRIAGVMSATVLFTFYHYAAFQQPVQRVVQSLVYTLVPYIIVNICCHWSLTLVVYIVNMTLLVYERNNFPVAANVGFVLDFLAITMSMLLYSSFSHAHDIGRILKSEKRYLRFFHENYAATAIVDFELTVAEVNASFAALLGATEDSLKTEDATKLHVGRSLWDYISPKDRERVQTLFARYDNNLRLSVNNVADIDCIKLDGREIPVQVSIRMLSGFRIGTPTYHSLKSVGSLSTIELGSPIPNAMRRSTSLLVTFIDLTAQKQAQLATMEAEREKMANEAKSRFLANMSHEIRTPLNGVLGMLQLLEDTPLEKEQKTYLKNGVISANILLSLINDILDFSKIEAGLLDIDEYSFDLKETLEAVVELLYMAASSKGLEFMCFIHPSVPELVRGDAGRLRQVLMNLVSNAIKFTHKGSVMITCTLGPYPGAIQFTVVDTGIGMREEDQQQLFQRFYQVDTSITRNYGGTGLGLAISRNLVQLMNGSMGVESKVGVGSKFWFVLNMKSSMESQPIRPSIGGHAEVAIVSPNKDVGKHLTDFFKSWNYHGATAYVSLTDAAGPIQAYQAANKEEKLLLVLCVKGNEINLHDLRLLRQIVAQDSKKLNPALLVFADKGFKTQLPTPLVSQVLSYPIQQTILEQALEMFETEFMFPTKEPSPTSPTLPRLSSFPKKKSQQPIPLTLVDDHEGQGANRPPRVLLVDDNAISRLMVAGVLQGTGVDCEQVGTGSEAITALFDTNPSTPFSFLPYYERFDMVLMDIHMPEMNGYQTTNVIRQREQLLSSDVVIPIIAISADDGVTLSYCLEHGMNGLCNFALANSSFHEVIASVVKHWLKKVRNRDRGVSTTTTSASESHSRSLSTSSSDASSTDSKSIFETRVLVVEDNVLNQQVIGNFLAKAGFLYDLACNGEDGVKRYMSTPYDIIFMDCQMPVMDGYEATVQIRTYEQTKNKSPVPIIAMTAHAMSGDREKCLRVGMSDYLQKPIQKPKLLAVIDEWLHKC